MANGKLKRPKSPGIDRIQTEPIIAGCRTIFFLKTLNSLVLFEIRRKCLKNWRSLSLYPSL